MSPAGSTHPSSNQRGGAYEVLIAGAAELGWRPGVETLTAVTHGPAGWLAVGGVVSGAAQHPIVVDSADGATWRAADGTRVRRGRRVHRDQLDGCQARYPARQAAGGYRSSFA